MELMCLTLFTLVELTLSVFHLAIFPGGVVRRLWLAPIALHFALSVGFVFKGAF